MTTSAVKSLIFIVDRMINLTVDVQNQHRGENDSNKDRLVTYIVSGVAGFLLLVVGILIMCLLRR